MAVENLIDISKIHKPHRTELPDAITHLRAPGGEAVRLTSGVALKDLKQSDGQLGAQTEGRGGAHRLTGNLSRRQTQYQTHTHAHTQAVLLCC